MASKRKTAAVAVNALVDAALPGAGVKRSLVKVERVPPVGLVMIRDGNQDNHRRTDCLSVTLFVRAGQVRVWRASVDETENYVSAGAL
jgi:hypothetical protein